MFTCSDSDAIPVKLVGNVALEERLLAAERLKAEQKGVRKCVGTQVIHMNTHSFPVSRSCLAFIDYDPQFFAFYQFINTRIFSSVECGSCH